MKDSLISTVLNKKYLIQKTIGEGSFATVYLATTLTTNKNVAIKVLYKRGLSATQLALQKEEIDILLTLRGVDNVIQLLEHIETKEHYFLVLEHCQVDLFDSIMEEHFDEYEAKRLFLQLANAVRICHEKSIYHRDLKPENILLKGDFNPTVKLADFGLATTKAYSTDFGCGSVRYMAPELFKKRTRSPYSAAANDVWSLAVIFINLLTRKNPWVEPYEGDNHYKAHILQSSSGIDSFQKQFNFSSDFCKVLRCCFQLDPSRRPTCKQLIEMVVKIDSFFVKNTSSIFVPSRKRTSLGLLTPTSMPKSIFQAQLFSLNQKRVLVGKDVSCSNIALEGPVYKQKSNDLLFHMELE